MHSQSFKQFWVQNENVEVKLHEEVKHNIAIRNNGSDTKKYEHLILSQIKGQTKKIKTSFPNYV